jgi:hypothetical protein
MCAFVCVGVFVLARTCACARVALLIQHAKTFAILSSAAPYLSTLSHKRHHSREKKVTEHKMCVFIFSATLFETFLTLRRIHQDSHTRKCGNVFRQSTRYSCQILMRLFFLERFFEESSNIKFNQNPSCGSGVVQHGRTDRQLDR